MNPENRRFNPSYTIKDLFSGSRVCQRCKKDFTKDVTVLGLDVLVLHWQAHQREDLYNLLKRIQIKQDVSAIECVLSRVNSNCSVPRELIKTARKQFNALKKPHTELDAFIKRFDS